MSVLTFTKPAAARTYRLLVLVLLLRPFGNLSLAWGMKHLPQIISVNPAPYVRAMLNPYVAAGIVLLILSLLIRMALLSLADLSYVLPTTAGGYIISAALGKFCLQENISITGWIGTLLVVLGAVLVGLTPRTTTEQAQNVDGNAQLRQQSAS